MNNTTKAVRWAAVCAALVLMASAFAQRSATKPAAPHQSAATASPEAWPDAPINDKSVVWNTHGDTSIPPYPLRLSGPTPAPLANDPLQAVTAPPAFRGRLLYAPLVTVPGKADDQHFFVLRGVNVEGRAAGITTSAATYFNDSILAFFDPQFSPDGRWALLKAGDGTEQYSSYGMLLWNLAAKTLRKIALPNNTGVSYKQVLWSPDSRYLAFVMEGDRDGNLVRGPSEPPLNLKLYTYTLSTGRDHLIARNPAVTSMAWTQRNTLLYTVLPEQFGESVDEDKHPRTYPHSADNLQQGDLKLEKWNLVATAQAGEHPSIFEVAAEGGPSTLIVPAGGDPLPSPDGKWIAFFGWPLDHEKKASAPGSYWLYLYNRATHKRVRIGSEEIDQVCWTPDSKRLVTVDARYARKGDAGQGTARIGVVGVADFKTRAVATVTAHDLVAMPRYQFNAQMAKSGKFLFLKTSEFTGKGADVSADVQSLCAVDLQSGKVSQLARFVIKAHSSLVGWDWRDEP